MRRLLAMASCAGAWHAAGELADGLLSKLTSDAFVRVYGPKVHGAHLLHDGLFAAPVDALLFFSSVAALLGGAGQANYSAANACLDAIATHRRGHGLVSNCIQWSVWSDLGMASRGVASRRATALQASSGLKQIGCAQGLRALASALLPGCPAVVSVMPVDWAQLLGPLGAVPALLTEFAPMRWPIVPSRSEGDARESSTTTTSTSCVKSRQVSTRSPSRLSLDEVLEMARRVAGHVVDPDAPLLESAMDSLGAVELRNQLQAAVGTRQRLSTTLVFDHPTVRQIAKLLSPEVMEVEVARQVEIHAAVKGSRAASSRVALAGGSCEMPGMVHSDAALRCVLTSSLDTVSPFPSARDGGSGPEVSCGHLATWTLFDHTAFSISVQQATAMDPQQRLVLEHAYGAFHDANLRRSSLDGSLTGVVVGIWSIERYVAGLQDPSQSVYNATNTLSVCAGRVAYALGLHGAAIAIDAACAASLVACHIGVRAIEANESPTQLIAGVNILWTADAVAGAVRAGMGSPSFRCYTFDTRADGYARAEACVAAALQLDLSGKWPISVAGSAARQDGRSASLTAPNGLAQEALLRAVYARGIQFEHVSQIEAHGTGTCS